jgi:predicted acylesterase/phospholipase RssA
MSPAPLSHYSLLRFLTRLQAVRQALGGSSSIEDLLIPFFCISTNLSELDQEVSFQDRQLCLRPQPLAQVHENGKLWPAVRASMTVVGLMPPMSRCLLLAVKFFC